MSAHRRPEPARVLEPDVGEHDDRRVAARRWRRGGRRGRPRPPRPRPRGARARRTRRRSDQLELRDALAALQRAVDLAPRPRRRAARRRRRRPGSRSASPIRMRSANEVRCGERKAPVRTPWASSSAAVMRTVELLPFVPDDVDRAEALLRASRARSAAAACARGRSACRTARARAGGPRPAPARPASQRRAAPRAGAASLSRSACTTAARRLGHEAARWPACPRRASISASSRARRSATRRACGLEVDGVGGEHGHAAAGHGHGGRRLAAVGATTSTRASRATCSAVRS